jgi:hypothetical protein
MKLIAEIPTIFSILLITSSPEDSRNANDRKWGVMINLSLFSYLPCQLDGLVNANLGEICI